MGSNASKNILLHSNLHRLQKERFTRAVSQKKARWRKNIYGVAVILYVQLGGNISPMDSPSARVFDFRLPVDFIALGIAARSRCPPSSLEW